LISAAFWTDPDLRNEMGCANIEHSTFYAGPVEVSGGPAEFIVLATGLSGGPIEVFIGFCFVPG